MNKKLMYSDFDASPKICMHDFVITKITPRTNSMLISLQGDLFLPNTVDNQTFHATNILVTIQGCTEHDLSCYYIRRYAPFHKSIRISTRVELSKILQLICNGKYFELIDEFYTNTQLYWRLSVRPSKKNRLSDEIELRINSFKSIEYEWN